ncbi:hypothetical protein SFR_3222 [Streptomyces sp. FR-008]|nr:hypothetical protein SFR_3222 [Streptomyces sp. FR-008]
MAAGIVVNGGVEYLAEVHAGSGAVRFFLGGTLAPHPTPRTPLVTPPGTPLRGRARPRPSYREGPGRHHAARTGVRG